MNYYCRMGIFFMEKLVLEVFSSMGIILGFWEVLNYNGKEEVVDSHSRTVAVGQIVGLLFFLRLIIQIVYYSNTNSQQQHQRRYYHLSIIRLFEIMTFQFVLEVLGSTASIWNFSDVLLLTNTNTTIITTLFRWIVAVIVGNIFMVLFMLQLLTRRMNNTNTIVTTTITTIHNNNDTVVEEEEDDDIVMEYDEQRPSWKRLYYIFSIQLILEVFASTSAIWGGLYKVIVLPTLLLEDTTTSNKEYYDSIWRFRSLFVGSIFLIRYILRMKDYILRIYFGNENASLLKYVMKRQRQRRRQQETQRNEYYHDSFLNDTIDDVAILLIVMENGVVGRSTNINTSNTVATATTNDMIENETTPLITTTTTTTTQ